jgi:lactoylglutathione lyase
MQLEHIAIWTSDLERLRQFYEDYFGGKAGEKYHNPKTGFSSYFLQFEGGARLELMQMPSIPPNKNDIQAQYLGIIHLAFVVGDEAAVDSFTERMAAEVFEVIGQPRRTGDGYYESVILDPDGNRIELVAKPHPFGGAK